MSTQNNYTGYIRTTSMALILIFIPFICLLFNDNQRIHFFFIPIIWGVLPYSILKLSILSRERANQSILAVFFWLYVYIFLGISPLLQICSNKFLFPKFAI